jgi:hypothetical protein
MSEIIRAKWIMGGATTLAEAAAKLRERAGGLDRMHAEGWTLEGPVSDDYGFALRPGEEPGEDEEGKEFKEGVFTHFPPASGMDDRAAADNGIVG